MGLEPAIVLPVFTEITDRPHRFFDILPENWKEDLVPVWPEYQSTSGIYALVQHNRIIGGGIVFRKAPPDVKPYEALANQLFDYGLLYFGFLWIVPDQRGRNYGSLWIKELKKKLKGQAFWLAVEELGLVRFYEKNSFRAYREVLVEDRKEWLMIPVESDLL
ncbi:MAG: GNAT family N-acetyltransferase [Cyclobacteriaceae bacterium]